MTVTVPLPTLPWPIPADRLALMKQARALLTDIDAVIVPVEALPGSPTRPLCFGCRPPWYGKYAPIAPANVNRVESIAAAMRLAVEDDAEDTRFDEAAWLSDALGCEVVEITNKFDLDALEFSGFNGGVLT